jgi:hypothetical protein
MLLPSGLINFPGMAQKLWGENRAALQQGIKQKPQLSLLWIHTQDVRLSRSDPEGTLVKGVALPNFWITLKNAARHLADVFKVSSMVIRHPEVGNLASLKQFKTADYVTDTHDVLRASLMYGSVVHASRFDFRKSGCLYQEQQRSGGRKRTGEPAVRGRPRTKQVGGG